MLEGGKNGFLKKGKTVRTNGFGGSSQRKKKRCTLYSGDWGKRKGFYIGKRGPIKRTPSFGGGGAGTWRASSSCGQSEKVSATDRGFQRKKTRSVVRVVCVRKRWGLRTSVRAERGHRKTGRRGEFATRKNCWCNARKRFGKKTEPRNRKNYSATPGSARKKN